jgi:hypothetical protein
VKLRRKASAQWRRGSSKSRRRAAPPRISVPQEKLHDISLAMPMRGLTRRLSNNELMLRHVEFSFDNSLCIRVQVTIASVIRHGDLEELVPRPPERPQPKQQTLLNARGSRTAAVDGIISSRQQRSTRPAQHSDASERALSEWSLPSSRNSPYSSYK